MIEEQAKIKRCPQMIEITAHYDYQGTVSYGYVNCIASECMMWRWISKGSITIKGDLNKKNITGSSEPAKGYCGLAGKEGA